MTHTPFFAAMLAAVLPVAALADDAAPSAQAVLEVSGAYARSTNPKVGAAFMTISNAGPTECVLRAASAPEVTDRAELHTHREENGVMSMVEVESIVIPAAGTHALARGGDHVMLIDTRAPMMQGDEFELILDFGDCGTVPVTVAVDNGAGMAHGETPAPMMHGHAAPMAQ